VCSLSYPACNANAPYCNVASLGIQYFSPLSRKCQDFRKNVVEDKVCVLIFPQFLSNIFPILRIIQQDVINVESSCKHSLFLPGVNET
jgi:hypothetical protein